MLTVPCALNTLDWEPFRVLLSSAETEDAMENDDKPRADDLPRDDKEREKHAGVAKERLDEIPAPGTDPLHEGP